MIQISKAAIAAERRRLLPPYSVATRADCLAAVDRLGFLWPFTPGTDLLPALFPALATDQEGQRWDWVWGWKDSLAATREAYYGKVVGSKVTLISREWLPVFYALTGNTGDLEDDLAHAAEGVRLHELAYKICRYLAEFGPSGTRTLIGKLTDGTPAMKRSLEKAIDQIDSAMLVAKCGTEGSNSFANMWDLFPRVFPDAMEVGTEIPTRDAAVKLMRQFFALTPALSEKALQKVFPWNEAHQQKAIARLLEAGEIEQCLVEGKPGLCRAGFSE